MWIITEVLCKCGLLQDVETDKLPGKTVWEIDGKCFCGNELRGSGIIKGQWEYESSTFRIVPVGGPDEKN